MLKTTLKLPVLLALFGFLFVNANAQEKTITFSLDFPGSSYGYSVEEVRFVKDTIWALTKVEAKGIGTTAITTLSASAKFKLPEGVPAASPVKQLVQGKSWNWGESGGDTFFLEKGQNVPDGFSKGKLLYKAAPKPVEKGPFKYIISLQKEDRLDEATARKMIEAKGAKFDAWLGALGMMFIIATPEQAEALKAEPTIKNIERDR